MTELPRAHFDLIDRVPYRLAFATLSGAHLYGFPSADSDFDIRGAHIAPLSKVLGLSPVRETHEAETHIEGRVDEEIVTHDVHKFFTLLLRNNGYVLEQIFSPFVIVEGILAELRPIASRCVTRVHYRHYLGFSENEWDKFANRPDKSVKRLLYAFRVVMTGLVMMRTGRVESNVDALSDELGSVAFINELLELKRTGQETASLPAGHGYDFYRTKFMEMCGTLEEAARDSHLRIYPETSAMAELDDLLLRLRLETR